MSKADCNHILLVPAVEQLLLDVVSFLSLEHVSGTIYITITVGRRVFPVAGSRLWDDLHVTCSLSVLTFKQRL